MNKGVFYGAAAYALWGFFPIYFKALHSVSAFQIVAHRVVWSFVFVAIVIFWRRELPALKASLNRRTLLIYLCAAILLAINWMVYVWSVNSGFVIEASLGYFINPLVNVLLGVLFLRERLRPAQWIPIGLAALGVIYLAFNYGSLPWIALLLATSFGLYGLVKKIAPLGSLHGLVIETGVLFLPALGYLLFEETLGVGAFGHTGVPTVVLLVLIGGVTAVPLLLFASGMRSVPMSTMGLLQYISPTLQFLIGVFLYGEAFTPARLVGFSIIWLALILFSTENIFSRRKAALTAAAVAAVSR